MIIEERGYDVETKQLNLLIVDDDADLLAILTEFFEQCDFVVDTATTAFDALALFRQKVFDIVILDLQLGLDKGSRVCQKMRKHSNTPILMLTGIKDDDEKIVCYEAGVDDYVTKPCRNDVLLAHINAILHRVRPEKTRGNYYQFMNWILDRRSATLTERNGTKVGLTTTLCDLLVVLLEHPQECLSREKLFGLLYGHKSNNLPFDRNIDIQLCRLRKKLGEDDTVPKYIRTIRSQGYEFLADVNILDNPCNSL